tara:strand:+ start:1097 stop:1588 length:492 start_codon:yes stop_codon:yes gene_type:complete
MVGRRFDDGKEEQALRTIGELGRALGLKPHVLRYWEEQFPMLKPLKRSGGRRYYRTEDVALVQTIDRLVNDEGYTLKGARAAIEKGRAGVAEARADDETSEAPREGVHRYLTAKDLPDRDEDAPPASFTSLAKRSAAGNEPGRLGLLQDLKSIRANLAAALGD